MDQANNNVQDPVFPAKDTLKKNSIPPDMPGGKTSSDSKINNPAIPKESTEPNTSTETSSESISTIASEKSTADKNSQLKQSEYAEKLPLFSKEQIKKYAAIAGLFFSIVLLAIGGIYAYQKLKSMRQAPPPIPLPDENTVIPPTPVEEPALFAYVKNRKEIWVADENGENKIKAVELSPGSLKTFTALNWKSKNQLSYSSCEEKIGCDLVTTNLNDKSTSLEDSIKTAIIRKFAFSSDKGYLAYIASDTANTNLYLKTGSITSSLVFFKTASDEANVKSRVFFTKDNQYIVFSTLRKDLIISKDNKTTELVYPVIYAFSPNGAKVDEIKEASDPFLIENNVIGYIQSGKFLYKEIGSAEHSEITVSLGLQPVMSPDRAKIAYWKTDDEFAASVVLGLFETKSNIHRNIIRGVILPTWIDDDKLIGIKVDNCIGESCLLYEFKTASIGIIDVNNGNIQLLDQGKSITEVFTNNAD